MRQLNAEPLVGLGDVRFGMTFEEVEAILGPSDRASAAVWGSPSKRKATWSNGMLSVTFSPKAEFIEVANADGTGVTLAGVEVFQLPAAEVVDALRTRGYTHDASAPEQGYSFVYRSIEAALWRQTLPESPDDEDGRYFETIGLGEPGYYAR